MKSCYNVYPRNDFGLLQREVDRIFGHASEAARPILGTSRIGEDEGNHYIELDAPGLKPDSLAVSVKEHDLTVRAEYGRPESESIDWRSGSPRTGEYLQRFKLPRAIDAEKIQATYTHGILRITVPKSEDTKPRQIAVDVH